MPDFRDLHNKAHAAGMASGNAAIPEPMHVVGHNSDGSKHYYPPVMDGACGFGWISVPGNCAYGRWAKKNLDNAMKGYPKGLHIWVRGFGQSYERKVAYARAYASVLKEAGVPDVYGSGRLD